METSIASRKIAPQSTSSIPQARAPSRSAPSKWFVCAVIPRWLLPAATQYQSAFILVSALPGSAPPSSAILVVDGRTGGPQHAPAGAFGRDQRHRTAPPRAGGVPTQPPRARQTRAGRTASHAKAPDSWPPPRGGRSARRGWRYLEHLARAGARHQSVCPGPRRDRADAAVRRARALAPLHARRHLDDDDRRP